jgi:hypothetical protein
MENPRFSAGVMWRCVFWHMFTHVSEQFSASIFRKFLSLLICLHPLCFHFSSHSVCLWSRSSRATVSLLHLFQPPYNIPWYLGVIISHVSVLWQSPLRGSQSFSQLSLFPCFSLRVPVNVYIFLSVLLLTCSIYSFFLKIVAPCSSETSVDINQITLVASQKTIIFMKRELKSQTIK